MFIEIQAPDANGTVCPLCGDEHLNIDKVGETKSTGYEKYSYLCQCPILHLSLWVSEYIESEDREATVINRVFITEEDYESYYYDTVISGAYANPPIFSGAYANPPIMNEEDAWKYHIQKGVANAKENT